MKSVLAVALFGVLIALSQAAKSSAPPSEGPESRNEVVRGQERGDKGHGGGGGGGGGGHGGSEGHGGHAVYHETQGQELFQGEEWMLLVPLVLIPLIVLACWYFMGSGKGDEGWGWDRMGYSDSSVGGYQGTAGTGSYDSRGFVPADTMDKNTHQRIIDSIQQQY